MPTRMVINTERAAGYKNKIMQPTPDIKLGINNDVNTDKKNSGAASHGRRSVKNKPAKQPSFQSNPQGSNKSAKKGGAPFSLHLLATRSSPNDHKPRHKQDAYCCGSTSFYRSVGLDADDSKISELFVCSNMIHSNYIRFSAADNFYVHRSRLNQLLLSFPRKGARIWKKILLSYVISAKTQA